MSRNTVNFNGAIDKMTEGIVSGLNKEYIPFIIPICQSRTPEDTGALKKSERAEVFVINNDTVICEVSANTEYAAVQHEMPNYMHNSGESGYILNPMNETIEMAIQAISSGIGRNLGGR